MGGPSAFHTGAGGRSITKAPLTCRRWAARLSGVEPSMRTTGPRTVLPFEPGAQAQLAAITSCARGAVIRTQRRPRSHLPPKLHCSSCAASPYSWNFLIVQSLAARAAGEPVRRGPIASEVLQVAHHLGAVQRLIDQAAGARGVDRQIL